MYEISWIPPSLPPSLRAHYAWLLARAAAPPARLLDIGAGQGRLLSVARGLVRERLVGIDPKKPGDRADHPIARVIGDGQRLPIARGAFDFVVETETLEWVRDPVSLLREAGRVCTTDGVVVSDDTDWDTLVFAAGDAALGRRILRAFCDSGPNGWIGRTAPSLYDLRNLYQVNVEEGRHLWAMVYLLHAHFGRDGREEAEALLERHAGDPDRPRILQAFNERTDDWLSFFMFTYFQDRDGKFQLAALAESGFDPLSRTCRFMLTEEAHHMFVGETGLMRVVQRTCELMREFDSDDVRAVGGVPLPMIQKWINFHYSICLDLFGSERSTNAANYFGMGLKGRYQEEKRDDDHRLVDTQLEIPRVSPGGIETQIISARAGMNLMLRRDFTLDSQRGLDRFNKVIGAHDIDFELTLPDEKFNRSIGIFSEIETSPSGELLDAESWERSKDSWLPTEEERDFVRSLMNPVTDPGKIAGWIAPPKRGIHGQPFDYEYVLFR